MYRSVRIIRIIVALAALAAPTFALVAGYDSVFARMQIMMAVITGSAIWLAVWAVATLIYGRIYCSTVCPLGTLMDCVAFFGRRSLQRGGYRYRTGVPFLRYTLTVAVILCMLGGIALIPSLLDPYSNYARVIEAFIIRPLHLGNQALQFTAATFAAALATATLILVVAGRRGRLLCNTICPVGGALGVISRSSVFHADINTDKCINCGECERVCKAECINLLDHTVDTSRCVVCFDCMAVCPNNAITYRTGNHRLMMHLMQPADSRSVSAMASSDISKPQHTHETISATAQTHTRKRH